MDLDQDSLNSTGTLWTQAEHEYHQLQNYCCHSRAKSGGVHFRPLTPRDDTAGYFHCCSTAGLEPVCGHVVISEPEEWKLDKPWRNTTQDTKQRKSKMASSQPHGLHCLRRMCCFALSHFLTRPATVVFYRNGSPPNSPGSSKEPHHLTNCPIRCFGRLV